MEWILIRLLEWFRGLTHLYMDYAEISQLYFSKPLMLHSSELNYEINESLFQAWMNSTKRSML